MYESISELSCVKYIHPFLSQKGEDIYEQLLSEITFNSDEESSIILYGKKLNIPRKQTAFGEDGTFYRFSGNTVQAKNFEESKTLLYVKENLEKRMNLKFNFCLVNYYEDGSKYIGPHSDDEKGLDPKHPIASVSFGETRPFRLRSKLSGKTYEQKLQNNSLILMFPPCQSLFKHSVPKTAKKIGGRINLTFRRVRTD